MHMPSALTKKLGPLPAWAWVLVIAGGVFAARKLRGSGSADTSNAAQDVGPVPFNGSDTPGGPSPNGPVGGGGSYDNPPTSGGFTPSPQSGLDPNELFGNLFESLNNAVGSLVSRPVIDANDTLIETLGELASHPPDVNVTVKGVAIKPKKKPPHKPRKPPKKKPAHKPVHKPAHKPAHKPIHKPVHKAKVRRH